MDSKYFNAHLYVGSLNNRNIHINVEIRERQIEAIYKVWTRNSPPAIMASPKQQHEWQIKRAEILAYAKRRTDLTYFTTNNPMDTDKVYTTKEISFVMAHRGQAQDEIRANLDNIRLAIPRETLVRILDIWDAWHLNDMNAGSDAQQECLKSMPENWGDDAVARQIRELYESKTGRDDITLQAIKMKAHNYYEKACMWLNIHGLLVDRGYRYGSAWLIKEPPQAVIDEIISLFTESEPEPEHDSPYDIEALIRNEHITMETTSVDKNPHMADAPRGMSHYKCTLKKGKKSLTVYYSMGSALTQEPEIKDILNCLASDAEVINSTRDFKDFAAALGYTDDSRKAEKIYKHCLAQTDKLKKFLGESYGKLLNCDRL